LVIPERSLQVGQPREDNHLIDTMRPVCLFVDANNPFFVQRILAGWNN
jgi:hypothetical protein